MAAEFIGHESGGLMRWRLQIEQQSDPIDVELVEIGDGAYTFQVGQERVTLANPKAYPFSLSTEISKSTLVKAATLSQPAAALDLTFEAWSRDHWRAVDRAETYTVRSLSWQTSSAGAQNEIRTQMPGRVLKLFVKAGDSVKANQTLLIVEAMKMENEIRAPSDAVIKEVSVTAGQSIESGAILLKLE